MTAHPLEALPEDVARDLAEFTIEVPSWGYGNSGTRFKVFSTPGTPRDPFEKIADAAQTHAYTGSAPRVSLHYPWDRVEDFGKLADGTNYAGQDSIRARQDRLAESLSEVYAGLADDERPSIEA